MIKLSYKTNYKTEKYLESLLKKDYRSILDTYGMAGVLALQNNTPVDTGKTANSWYYEISESRNGFKLTWKNKNVVDGVNIAIILQYGHGTLNGGYVQGIDYINPALKDIFEELKDKLMAEVR